MVHSINEKPLTPTATFSQTDQSGSEIATPVTISSSLEAELGQCVWTKPDIFIGPCRNILVATDKMVNPGLYEPARSVLRNGHRSRRSPSLVTRLLQGEPGRENILSGRLYNGIPVGPASLGAQSSVASSICGDGCRPTQCKEGVLLLSRGLDVRVQTSRSEEARSVD